MSEKADIPVEDTFYGNLVKLTEKAIEDNVSLESIFEILVLHALNTFLRNPDNSFCCATDLMLQIMSQWFSHHHIQSLEREDEENSCFCDTPEDEDDDGNASIH